MIIFVRMHLQADYGSSALRKLGGEAKFEI